MLADTEIRTFSTARLEAADALGGQLIRLGRGLNRARVRFVKTQPEGLEQAAFAILAILVVEGSQRTSTLAELLQIEVSGVSRQTRDLVRYGLIERHADPADGRACLRRLMRGGGSLNVPATPATAG